AAVKIMDHHFFPPDSSQVVTHCQNRNKAFVAPNVAPTVVLPWYCRSSSRSLFLLIFSDMSAKINNAIAVLLLCPCLCIIAPRPSLEKAWLRFWQVAQRRVQDGRSNSQSFRNDT
ncbi:MAG TPA: hypothetical protein VNO32_56055, partial [Candidatus Acidoferrum sp.]|nr:hypothetical protein [Candidatus Acidoferrum sp.]